MMEVVSESLLLKKKKNKKREKSKSSKSKYFLMFFTSPFSGYDTFCILLQYFPLNLNFKIMTDFC